MPSSHEWAKHLLYSKQLSEKPKERKGNSMFTTSGGNKTKKCSKPANNFSYKTIMMNVVYLRNLKLKTSPRI